MSAINTVVATFANRHLAESTLKELQDAKFDPEKVSLLSKEQMDVAANAAPSEKSGLNRVLSICIPDDTMLDYEAELNAGRSILLAFGSADEMARAKDIIESAQPDGWDGSANTSVYYGCAV
jgi:hypothetical protein